MPVFPKPKPPLTYDVDAEIAHLRAHKATRGIPTKAATRLLVATWNIANFGAQERRPQDLRLIAEILSWFDVVAIQECRENYGDLANVAHTLGPPYRLLLSDAAGNNERMAFVYDSAKLALLEEIGEVSFPPSQLKHVKLLGITAKFEGWDRNPYFASFQASAQFAFSLC